MRKKSSVLVEWGFFYVIIICQGSQPWYYNL